MRNTLFLIYSFSVRYAGEVGDATYKRDAVINDNVELANFHWFSVESVNIT